MGMEEIVRDLTIGILRAWREGKTYEDMAREINELNAGGVPVSASELARDHFRALTDMMYEQIEGIGEGIE